MKNSPNHKDRLRLLRTNISRLERRNAALAAISARYWSARRWIVGSGLVVTLLCYELVGHRAAWLAFALVVIIYSIVAHYHAKVRGSAEVNKLWLAIKSTQTARIELDWDRLPEHDSEPPRPGHPFEFDLDITGKYSLHRLIDTTLTSGGSKRLKDWLLSTEPELDVILKRQALAQELSSLSLFREKLLLLSALAPRRAPRKWETERILEWLDLHGHGQPFKRTLITLTVLSAVSIVLFSLYMWAGLGAYWLLPWSAYFLITLAQRDITKTGFEQALVLEEQLKNLQSVFSHLEKYHHANNPNVAALCQPFLDANNRPSAYLKRISRVASGLSFRRGNPYLWGPVQAIIPLDFWLTYFFDRYRGEIAVALPKWLEVWFELDALTALANYAFLNPDYIFPELQADGDTSEPVFQASEIGHPLIPKDKRVCNDFQFNEHNRIAILTGSNMAGKSTFLRTLGTNLCLAYAGAPVAAEQFKASMLQMYTCIRVNDSVTDGLSYFYSEVKRLKSLLESVQAGGLPHFVLIDEIFRGTNNRERRIGSWSYIKALAALPVIGAVATHDLGLIKLADEIEGISNYHFREEIKDGRMVFDFRLHPGPCPTTNALKIMELEGLPVEVPDPASLAEAEA
jgi:hypothetical protein